MMLRIRRKTFMMSTNRLLAISTAFGTVGGTCVAQYVSHPIKQAKSATMT